MFRFLQNFVLDRLSFWVGFFTGALALWFFSRLRLLMPRIIAAIKGRIKSAREGALFSTELRMRNDTIHMAQAMHLATSLFALDEILVKPRLLAPSPPPEMENSAQNEEGSLRLPYLPDWPELAAAFNAPTLSLIKALEGGMNLAVTGRPGSGKTVLLAHLASLVARQKREEIGDLADTLPVLLHVADLPLGPEALIEPLQPVITAVAETASVTALPRLPGILRSFFEQGNALLLLDGLDELPTDPLEQYVEYLSALLKKYPSIRVVAAASPDHYDGLIELGLAPVALAAWTERQKAEFLHAWGHTWTHAIVRSLPEGTQTIDPLLLNNWILGMEGACTPLEFTLRTWAAYTGDATGPSNPDAIEAYLTRMTTGIPKARQVLEKLASQMLYTQSTVVEARQAEKWVPELSSTVQPFDESELGTEEETTPGEGETQVPAEPPEATIEEASGPAGESEIHIEDGTEGAAVEVTTGSARTGPEKLHVSRVLPDLMANGLLVERLGSRLNFFHPAIAGYLAGSALASSGDIQTVCEQMEWTGKTLALHYLAAWNDLTELVMPMLQKKDDPLQRSLLTAGEWLKDASRTARWRPLVMRQLATLMQKEILSLGLRARLVLALVNSGDPGVLSLLRQLLTCQPETLRLLAVFGIGILKDSKSTDELIRLLEDPVLEVGQAAMVALTNIRSKPAMEAIASTLLGGSEPMRRAAAEALAADPEEGHQTLEEGAAVEDLLVRRAVVYGLARVNQEWSIKTLEKMQIEDGQWVVRSAATQALEELQRPDPSIPRPLPALTESPWLVAFAAKEGVGVSPGKPAQELLIRSLKSGEHEQKLAALYYLSRHPDVGAVPSIYQLLYGGADDLREAAYDTLRCKAAAGIELPSPTQFGLG